MWRTKGKDLPRAHQHDLSRALGNVLARQNMPIQARVPHH
jgi:hypothetical protein